MVWLSGGMFAIACLMIVSLLAFVLWQGLWTLWPRTYSIYGRKDGTLVGGELYAKASLEGQETLYLRTGNYDVSNQHFAYVSSSELVEQSGWLAPDLWLVERKEWGNLYGFPKQLSWAQAAPEDFVRLVQDGMRQTAQIDRELGEAKNELKRIDHNIAEARLGIRRVELAERIDLQKAAETGSLEGLSPSARDAVSKLVLRNRQADEMMVEINDRIAGLEAQRRADSGF